MCAQIEGFTHGVFVWQGQDERKYIDCHVFVLDSLDTWSIEIFFFDVDMNEADGQSEYCKGRDTMGCWQDLLMGEHRLVHCLEFLGI